MFNDDHKEVRQCVTNASVDFVKNCGTEILNQFLPLYKKFIDDEKWRVRHSTYDALIKIAVQQANSDLFFKNIEPLFMNYLKDKVFAV